VSSTVHRPSRKRQGNLCDGLRQWTARTSWTGRCDRDKARTLALSGGGRSADPQAPTATRSKSRASVRAAARPAASSSAHTHCDGAERDPRRTSVATRLFALSSFARRSKDVRNGCEAQPRGQRRSPALRRVGSVSEGYEPLSAVGWRLTPVSDRRQHCAARPGLTRWTPRIERRRQRRRSSACCSFASTASRAQMRARRRRFEAP